MRINILGTSFVIETNEDPEYLEKVVRFYESKIREVKSSVDTKDNMKIAILSGILVADEYLRISQNIKQQTNGSSEETNLLTQKLINTIDKKLSEIKGTEMIELKKGSSGDEKASTI